MPDDKRLDDHIAEDRSAFLRIEGSLHNLNEKLDRFKDQINWRILCGLGGILTLVIEKAIELWHK